MSGELTAGGNRKPSMMSKGSAFLFSNYTYLRLLTIFFVQFPISGYGPPSLFLCRGTVLKTLPRILLGYGKLLVNILHSDSYVINSENFRNLNEQLKNGCILLQGYGIRAPGELYYEAFPFAATDKEPNKWSGHKAVRKLQEHLDLKHHCGYITFVNTGVADIGCDNYELEVRLRHPKSKLKAWRKENSQKELVPNKTKIVKQDIEELPELPKDLMSPDTTEVCSFARAASAAGITATTPQHNLKTPDENYFSSSPKNNEPSAVYTSEYCNELLASELAMCKPAMVSQGSLEVRLDKTDADANGSEEDLAEEWTLLDVNFGVPLFDVDSNTRICEQIVRHLCSEDNLNELPHKSREMFDKFNTFIKQCLYFEDEQMDQLKIGKNLPHPRINLAFENGRVCYWNGR